MLLKSPYPYFGGKSRVAELVWSKFGDVKNYVEPFFGSGAVLLSRPHWPFDGVRTRIETVNDYDAMAAVAAGRFPLDDLPACGFKNFMTFTRVAAECDFHVNSGSGRRSWTRER